MTTLKTCWNSERVSQLTSTRKTLWSVVCLFLFWNVASAQTPRPAGLGYTPSYVPAYNSSASSADIPADALDRSAYGSTSAWLDACLAQNKPGKIGSGTYSITSSDLAKYAPKGI